MSRFGEGEIKIIQGNNIDFQEFTPLLQQRLHKILKQPHPKNCLALPNIWGEFYQLTGDAQSFWSYHLLHTRKIWQNIQLKDYQYLDALITRPYMDIRLKSKSEMQHKFRQWQTIWQDKKVLIVEGMDTHFGDGNDLLANALQVKRILVPAQNAFGKYTDILRTTRATMTDFDIILLAIGPTATVLADDLAGESQVIDIGHLDLEYEWFLQQAEEKVALNHRIVNESATAKQSKVADVKDIETFKKSVIAIID